MYNLIGYSVTLVIYSIYLWNNGTITANYNVKLEQQTASKTKIDCRITFCVAQHAHIL